MSYITAACRSRCGWAWNLHLVRIAIRSISWMTELLIYICMVFIYLISTWTFAGGHSTFFALLNSFVHIVMYFYYMIAAMGPKYQKFIWWKKYLTTFQMVKNISKLCLSNSLLLFLLFSSNRFSLWLYLHISSSCCSVTVIIPMASWSGLDYMALCSYFSSPISIKLNTLMPSVAVVKRSRSMAIAMVSMRMEMSRIWVVEIHNLTMAAIRELAW